MGEGGGGGGGGGRVALRGFRVILDFRIGSVTEWS